MNRKSGDIEIHRRHLQALRRGCADVAEHIAKSQEAIERSLALLRLMNEIEPEQKPQGSPLMYRPRRE